MSGQLRLRHDIMLISHIQLLTQVEGVTDLREAVVRGAEERLVPILMTAMAAGLALIPLALGGGKTGSEIQTPMAIVILWADDLDIAQHVRRADTLFALRTAGGTVMNGGTHG